MYLNKKKGLIMSSIMRIKNEQGVWESVVSLKGEGVQPGGLTGQYLVKKSNDDFDYRN